jgi:hypothetical protein
MTDVTAYQSYRQQAGAEIASRVTDHQAAIATIKPGSLPAAAAPLILLADGDSWFDYPLNGMGEQPNSDVIAQLPACFANPPQILSLAHYGDATTTLLGTGRRNMLVTQMKDTRNGRFDAILFSGGGNDLVGDQFRLWLRTAPAGVKDPVTAINHQAFAAVLSVVQSAYQDLIATRDLYLPGTPIFVHAYDFAQPNNTSVCNGLLGPWLYPSLCDRGWMSGLGADQIAFGASIVKLALTQFSLMLGGFASQNVIQVNTFGAVAANQWDNELHPTPQGFINVAGRFATTLQTRFGARAAPPAAAVASQQKPQTFEASQTG